MKTAFYLPDLRGGGAEKVAVTLINGLSHSADIEIDLILNRRVGPYLKELPPGVNIIETGSRKIHFDLFKLIRYLQKEKPDILITSMTLQNLVAILARRILPFSKTKIIVHEHYPLSAGLKVRQDRVRFYFRLSKYLYPFADQVVTVSENLRKEFIEINKLPPHKVRSIHNPFDIETIQTKAAAGVTHRWLHAKRDYKLIVAAGRLDVEKDYPALLKAFAGLIKQQKAKLIILGQGKEELKLKALSRELGIADHVDFTGFVENPYAYVKAADLFVLSSQFESFGNVIIEALALGTPVVSTDCPVGPREILENGKIGRLVPVGDTKRLVEAMAQTIEMPIDKEKLVNRAKDFELSKIIKQWLILFSSLNHPT